MNILKEVMSYKESVIALSITFFGVLVCFVGGNFIQSETISFIVVVIGGFVSISGTTEFAKIVRMVQDKNSNK